jgi:hypothetical protein
MKPKSTRKLVRDVSCDFVDRIALVATWPRSVISLRLQRGGSESRMVAMIVAITLLPHLVFFPAKNNSTAKQTTTDTQQFYRRLAYFHAPINFQDTEVRGQSQDEGNRSGVDQPIQRRGDFMNRFDFDGDWNGLNNWANLAERPPNDYHKDERVRAYMYYSVVETATHYFINYCSYHAHDREPRCSDSECHENDLEGGLHMVKKGPENGGMGSLWLMMYLAHDDWYTYLTPAGRAVGVRLGGKGPHETPEKAQHSNSGFIYDVVWAGITPDGKLFMPRDPHVPSSSDAPPGTIFRPTTWQEPWGHGMYGWPVRDAKSPYDRYRKPEYTWNNGFINGDGVIYYPGAKAGIPDYRQPVDTVPYALIDIFEANGLWDRRERIDWKMDGCGGGLKGTPDCTWGYFGGFRGERWGVDKANAPWRWDHHDDHLPPGMQAFDPLRLIEEYNNLDAVAANQLARAYTQNRYLGIPKGTRPERPPPRASAGARMLVVKPGETFVLDGSRSQTSDLNGRGHLLYRWESAIEGWQQTGWDQSRVQKLVAREGTYRVKLIVNDGDHEASDEMTIVVTSRKLFFDDFQSASPQAQWRFMGRTWQQKEGQLIVRRPGAGLNAALLPDQAFSGPMILETLTRLDLLYPEAAAPFGVGVAYPFAGQPVLLFGFVGTRRIDTLRDPKRTHLSELAFYEVSSQKRVRLGTEILTYRDASASRYQLGHWYHIKLLVEGGRSLKAKVWPLGTAEPDWMYSLMLEQPRSGPAVPLLAASTSTNGEAAFDYFLVTRK